MLAAGLLIDAFIVRTVLTPAVMSLVGERSRWPSRRLNLPARARVPGPEPTIDAGEPAEEGRITVAASPVGSVDALARSPPTADRRSPRRGLVVVGVAVLGLIVALARRRRT